jgi:Uncharacterized conserved protein
MVPPPVHHGEIRTQSIEDCVSAYLFELKTSIEDNNQVSMEYMREMYLDVLAEELFLNFNSPYGDASCERLTGNYLRDLKKILENVYLNGDTIILGEAGIGKTFLIENMVFELISNKIYDKMIPILIRMRSYDGSKTPEQNIKMNLSSEMVLQYENLKGKLVIFLDALDEIPTSSYGEIKILHEYLSIEKIKWVASCRNGAYLRNKELRMGSRCKAYRLKLWDLPEIKEFISNLDPRHTASVIEYMCGRDISTIEAIWNKFKRANELNRFWDTRCLDRQQSIGEPVFLNATEVRRWKGLLKNGSLTLSRNPYMLKMIYEVYLQGGVDATQLDAPSAIIKKASEKMINDSKNGFKCEEMVDFLCNISSEMKNEGRGEVPINNIKTSFECLNDDMIFENLLNCACRSKIIAKHEDKIRFTHKKLQEYYASVSVYKKICSNENTPYSKEDLYTIIEWGGDLTKIIPSEKIDMDKLIESLQEHNRSTELLNIKDKVEQYCIELLSNTDDMCCKIKHIGTLGRLGIVDAGAGCMLMDEEGSIPEIEWCAFTASTGNQKNKKTIRMSKFPITVCQFKTFIDDEGYSFKNKSLWCTEGWEWKIKNNRISPTNWFELKKSNLPVTNVTWYEASAFCCWLSEKICEKNKSIRLPTEEEWDEISKIANAGFLEKKCVKAGNFLNSQEENMMGTVPVGLFKGEEEKYPCDMYGNVWEWCEDNCISTNGIIIADSKIIKGISWRNQMNLIFQSDKSCHVKYNSSNCIGFRVIEVENENINRE